MVYIVADENNPDGIYKIGKTTNLTERLSQYNSGPTCRYVVYHIDCYTEGDMDEIERSTHAYLRNYRVYENREVFKLPDGETIDFFINIIRGLVDLIHTFLKSVQNV